MSVFLLLKLFGGFIIAAVILTMVVAWLMARSVDRAQAEQERDRGGAS